MTLLVFRLDHSHIALYQLLKLTGVCDSGGQAKQCIANGEVLVDGETEYRKACKIHAGQIVQFRNTEIRVNGLD